MPYLLTCSYKLLFVQAVDKSVIKKKQTYVKVPIPIMGKAFLMGDVNAIMKEENGILLLLFIPLLLFSDSYFQLIAYITAFVTQALHIPLLLSACGKLENSRKAWMK